MILPIIGPQASGKGTQASRLAKHYGLFHFSSGDVLRDEVKSGSDLGKEVARIMNSGKLVSDELIYDIIKKICATHPEGILFDGCPRTLAQAERLVGELEIDLLIEISIPDETALKRVTSRFHCSQCARGYNTVSLPPRTAGICDDDEAPLVQRDDDMPEAVKKRLTLYHRQTVPVIEFYRDLGVSIRTIDGEQSIDEVFEEIRLAIDSSRETGPSMTVRHPAPSKWRV